jgi:hypothetical protein
MLSSKEGSDCPTGKMQYATKDAARQAAAAKRRRMNWRNARSYQCPWCRCFHIGNPRGDNSKARKRR